MYHDIAQAAYRLQIGPLPNAPAGYDRLRYRIAHLLYRQMLVLLYLATSGAIFYVPWFGPILNFFGICWITSFYAFDYRWNISGLTLEQRIRNLER